MFIKMGSVPRVLCFTHRKTGNEDIVINTKGNSSVNRMTKIILSFFARLNYQTQLSLRNLPIRSKGADSK